MSQTVDRLAARWAASKATVYRRVFAPKASMMLPFEDFPELKRRGKPDLVWKGGRRKPRDGDVPAWQQFTNEGHDWTWWRQTGLKWAAEEGWVILQWGPSEHPCPECQETIKNDTKFCPFCGTKSTFTGDWGDLR
jgi:hypothetical protein